MAAIDDIIDRGGVDDWRELKSRADADSDLVSKIIKVCAAKISDPYAQRYHPRYQEFLITRVIRDIRLILMLSL